MALKPFRSNPIVVQSASPLADLREAPKPVRFAVASLGSSVFAYYACFGVLATVGIWKSTLLNPVLLLMVALGLSLQSLIVWLVRVRPIVGHIILGTIWTIPLLYAILRLAGPSDLSHGLVLGCLPLALSAIVGFLLNWTLPKLSLPIYRGAVAAGSNAVKLPQTDSKSVQLAG